MCSREQSSQVEMQCIFCVCGPFFSSMFFPARILSSSLSIAGEEDKIGKKIRQWEGVQGSGQSQKSPESEAGDVPGRPSGPALTSPSRHSEDRGGLGSGSGTPCQLGARLSLGFAPDALCGLSVVLPPVWFLVPGQVRSRLGHLWGPAHHWKVFEANRNHLKFWQTCIKWLYLHFNNSSYFPLHFFFFFDIFFLLWRKTFKSILQLGTPFSSNYFCFQEHEIDIFFPVAPARHKNTVYVICKINMRRCWKVQKKTDNRDPGTGEQHSGALSGFAFYRTHTSCAARTQKHRWVRVQTPKSPSNSQRTKKTAAFLKETCR